MPYHYRAGLDHLCVGTPDTTGHILIQLVRDAPANVIGLKAVERVGHHD